MVKPSEILFHAEIHYRSSSDYDKRMAYINFDNSIEVSIYTFMSSNTKPRGEKIYQEKELDDVKNSFFNKIEKFINYIKDKGLPIYYDTNIIDYYHKQRNNLYHSNNLTTPDNQELNTIREIAMRVFSTLFNISNVQSLLDSIITEAEKSFPEIPKELVPSKIQSIKQTHENSFFIASILGGWNENSQGDNEIINEVTSGF